MASQKYILLNSIWLNQGMLEYGTNSHSSTIQIWNLQCIFGDLVAQATNSTLITVGHSEFESGIISGTWQETKHTRMIPSVHVFGDTKYTVEHIWNDIYRKNLTLRNLTRETTAIAGVDSEAISPAYCAIPKTKWDSGTFHYLLILSILGFG